MASDEYNDEPSETPKGLVEENEDGTVTVKLAAPAEELPDEAYNLVPHYSATEKGKKFLDKLANKVCKDFDRDWKSCEKWREKRKTRWQLMVGDMPPKDFPFEECANVHLPVMMERVLRIVHRLLGEILPDRDVIFQAVAANDAKADKAEIVTLNENWQFKKEISDFGKQNRRALMEFVANGDCIFWSYRDIPNKRNRHEALSCEEIVFPYHWKTNTIDMSDIPRKTRIIRKYRHELRELEAQGVYANVDVLLEKEKNPSWTEDDPELTVRPAVDEYEGKEPPDDDPDTPYTLREYHGWCKLPGQEAERPIVAVVEAHTKVVLCLYLREENDWKDQLRFDRQMSELVEFRAMETMHAQAQQREMEVRARLALPDVDPEERMMLEQGLTETAPPPPVPPKWMAEGAQGPPPVRRVPIEYGSHGVCIENLDGSLGLGIGLLLEEFNKTADTAASQFSDAGTLANVATIIKHESVKFGPGVTELTPGEMHSVRGIPPGEIDSGFKVIQFPPANGQLLEVVRLSLEAADGVSSAPDVLSGEPGKSNETYRGLATRVEQATKQLTVLAQNYLEMLGNVAKNNFRLNRVFLGDDEPKSVIDPRTQQPKDINVGRALYAEDYDIVFTADTRFTSRDQKIAEADQLVGMVTALPPELGSQIFPPSFVRAAVEKSLKARGAHEMIRFLGPPPPIPVPQPPMPQGMPMPGMPPGPPPGLPPGGGPPQPGPPNPMPPPQGGPQ